VTTPIPPRYAPPAYLDDTRKATWTETIERLMAAGRLFGADPALITVYVENVHAHREASTIIARSNVLIMRGDRAEENPALATQRRAADALTRAARALGLHRPGQPAPTEPGQPAGPVVVGEPADRAGGARWCAQHGRHECTHHRNRRACGCPPGAPPRPDGCCHRAATPGTDSCPNHAGLSRAQVLERAQVNLARTYGVPVEIDPVAGLLAEVRWSWGHVCALRHLVESIEAQAPDARPGAGPLWQGAARTVTRDGEAVEITTTAGEHVVLQAYYREREHFTRVCSAAISAGAQQSAIDLAKAAAANFGRLLDAIFAALFDLPPDLAADPAAVAALDWQRGQLPVVVPREIRRWDPDAAAGAAGQ
jgi:hypothetical protein